MAAAVRRISQMCKWSNNEICSRIMPQIARQIQCGSVPIQRHSSSQSISMMKQIPQAAYGGRHTVTVLPGDGVGPELIGHVKEVVRFSGAPIDFETIELDADHGDEDYLNHAILAIKRNGVALKAPLETNYNKPGEKSKNVELRTKLDLFANVLHVKSIPGIPTRHHGIDIYVIRENTEGEYSNLEHESVPGVVENLKIITAEKSRRIAKYAFDFAESHGRKKVTAIHKANIMKLGDGLFLECCTEVSKMYPNIEFEGMIVDNCSMQMVSKPQQFDVMVMPNLYGNIIGNIGAGLIGGPGVVAGMNVGEEFAIFETGTRNSGRSIQGKNIANPAAMLLASAKMLEHLGLKDHAHLIKAAVYKVISDEQIHTPDLGGQATTLHVVQAIVKDLKEQTQQWYTHFNH